MKHDVAKYIFMCFFLASLGCEEIGSNLENPDASDSDSVSDSDSDSNSDSDSVSDSDADTDSDAGTDTDTVSNDDKYQWHTFLGSALNDEGSSIALDEAGNIYVVGGSEDSWLGPDGQNPLNAHCGSRNYTIVKLDASGFYQWHAFYGETPFNFYTSIWIDSTGNLYITGESFAWDGPDGQSPLNPHDMWGDAFILKLDTDGAYQ